MIGMRTTAKSVRWNGRHLEPRFRSQTTRAFFLLLSLATLLYSWNLLEWREEEILAVAALAIVVLAASMPKRLLIPNSSEIVIVVLFSVLVIAQQYVLADGSIVFGIKYAVVLLATFLPYWIAHILGGAGTTPRLERTVTNAIGLLLVVAMITVLASHLFDKGEVHVQPSGFTRAFGWLGDSFSPVIVFFVLYYLFRKMYLVAAIAAVMLLLTVAKTAFLMLILSPLVLVFSAARSQTRIVLAALYVIVLSGLMMFAQPVVEGVSDMFQADYSYYARVLSIYSGLEYFFSDPLTGIGINQSLLFIEGDSRQHADVLGVESHFNVYQIDNAFVRTAAETGVFGLVLLLLFCYVLLSTAFQALRAGEEIFNPRERAIVLASSLWVIAFILFYQTTGWFEAGHPQLCWLLLFSTLSGVFYRRCRTPVDRCAQIRRR